ncbi:tRNA (guanosine(46)-N7)-methyltransferase TrmB [Candidatus Peregrinibacteria bacterium]|jgi:tRNA (guanine-N7-)-methyltransferase|nr:tRNA (guanosine(46)-N7)-methyltransferase TrmB [Candidatus Peregrinibacteria bacterium]MBT4632229.1 tRNA (guanosine(46)-N7)-methyltransferase TrmB [Candidatus Peregrinibacteria bacterium]MBT5516672.1 tRNA (guanosine(46)-N7)-methyltransferase TrmB [Candidatus Peregrinibacteria bacterium]MBT5824360.1 tRNA (guanosine(46)-N7)-methyltransferase TrmB [Candidatus Peregrinibacteria bacterium]
MTRKKLKHFADMKEWSNVLEPALGGAELEEAVNRKGSWGDRVVLELGCGRGDYSLALAENFHDASVVGIDIKGARMWHGANAAKEMGLENVFFLRARIEDLADYFEEGEVDEIWVTFPDPHPRKGKAKKRLTSPRFLGIYKYLLKNGGIVHFKTDDLTLFDYSVETALAEAWNIKDEQRDIYKSDGNEFYRNFQTQYERRFIGEDKPIYYLAMLCST